MPKLIVMVGPAGAGKSTYSKKFAELGFAYINQDAQGRAHLELFEKSISEGKDVIVDRMGFTKHQRDRYLEPAKKAGYETEIIVLHQSYYVCLDRCLQRKGHETITEEKHARGALDMFFSKYERPLDSEADKVTRIWPEGEKPSAIICDLDGTLADCEHRRHFVNPDIKPEGFKKNWKAFFDGIYGDTLNEFCYDILKGMSKMGHQIVFASGRDDNYRKVSTEWLKRHNCWNFNYDKGDDFYLYMRHRNDSRQDYIVKEIILDFEILTRFTPYFMLDDRDQVVQMWRKRGFTCLQVANGDF